MIIALCLVKAVHLILSYCMALPLVKVADFLNNFLGFHRAAKPLYWVVYGVSVFSSNMICLFVSEETQRELTIKKEKLKHGLGLD